MTEFYEIGRPLEQAGEGQLYPATVKLLHACRGNPYISICELRYEEGDSRSEIIVIEAGDGCVADGNPAGILRCERIALVVNPLYPVKITAQMLRKDFPSLSHQHASSAGEPKILCMYEVAWSAVERAWTAERFISRIFWWLRESAEHRLHRDDQPLEQLFYLSPVQLILPSNHLEYSKPDSPRLAIEMVEEFDGSTITLRAVPASSARSALNIRVLALAVSEVESKSVANFPSTLGKLHEQMLAWGSGLAQPLYASLYEAAANGLKPSLSNSLDWVLILIWVPRRRHGKIERYDVQGYVTQSSLFELAKAFDVIGTQNSDGSWYRHQPLGGSLTNGWQSYDLQPVEIRPSLTRKNARDLAANGASDAEFSGVLAGVGALGGMLAETWIREGWGKWTFIDPDQLLPHNLQRHVGFDFHLGHRKVNVLQHLAKAIYPAELAPNAIVKSVIDTSAEVVDALQSCQLIVDVTTTLEAPRELAVRDGLPRTASLFLTPSGNSSVMMLEDSKRTLRVDAIEGQYYRAILNCEWGDGHLVNHQGDRWVGGGCRDISVRMSGDFVHLHSGILSRQLRQSLGSDEARLCVWESDPLTSSVRAHEVPLCDAQSERCGEWLVKYDRGLKEKMFDIRQSSLPNETGGAILGITDFKSKTIVLVDVLPAPSDSDSSPCHFVRGKEGQLDALESVYKKTARIVDYVGDWHSHPKGYPAKASKDDENLLDTLHAKMSEEGLPAVMVIVSDNQFYIDVR